MILVNNSLNAELSPVGSQVTRNYPELGPMDQA